MASLMSSVKAGGGTGHIIMVRFAMGVFNSLLYVVVVCTVRLTKIGLLFRRVGVMSITVVRALFGLIAAVMLIPVGGLLLGFYI